MMEGIQQFNPSKLNNYIPKSSPIPFAPLPLLH